MTLRRAILHSTLGLSRLMAAAVAYFWLSFLIEHLADLVLKPQRVVIPYTHAWALQLVQGTAVAGLVMVCARPHALLGPAVTLVGTVGFAALAGWIGPEGSWLLGLINLPPVVLLGVYRFLTRNETGDVPQT